MFPIEDTTPRRNLPLMIWTLILINGMIFLFALTLPKSLSDPLFHLLGIVPARFTDPAWASWFGIPVEDYWPFLTHMFLHVGWIHFVGNMWTLWIFGDNVEDRMGSIRFLLFYLLCGVIAGVVHWTFNPDSTAPAVGASGAVAGVMGAYLFLFPYSRIVVLFPLFLLPLFFKIHAVTFLSVWFVIQVLSGSVFSDTLQVGGIAWWAHIGGFVAGVLLYPFFLKSDQNNHPGELPIETIAF